MKKEIPEDEKRIMQVFGIADHNKIPARSNKTMKIYYEFLKKKLTFPIYGSYEQETGLLSSKSISIKLYDLSDQYDDFYGILIEGKANRRLVAVPLVDFTLDNEDDENFQIIDDYKTWFCNW